MKFSSQVASAAILAGAASAGTVVWDGRFNDYASSSDLSAWSFSNPVGDYQYYIHGTGNVTDYVNLSSDFKNPADTASSQGVKISLTSTAYWEGQNMRRTELIPQTSDTSAISSGKVYYHFSMKKSAANPPAETREHQIAFFESHFTEMKAGWISGESNTTDARLQWFAGGQSQWSVGWEADVWHNVAYEIDFSAGTVGFWHSTGSDALAQVVAPVTASTSSNGADWHVGVLELPRDGYTDTDEDIYFSGVYIETGDLTTAIGGGASSGSSSSAVAGTTTAASTSAATSAVSTTAVAETTTTAAATSAASSTVVPVQSTTMVTSTTAATTSSAAAETPVTTSSVASSTLVAVTTSAAAATSEASSSTSSSAVVVPTTSSAAPSSSAPPKTCKRRKARKARNHQ